MSKIDCATVVVGVRALPGTYSGRDSNISEVIDHAVEEAMTLYSLGIRSIMLQNVNDVPAYNTAPVYTVAYMTAVCAAVKNSLGDDCRLGISILRNDTPACIAIADAVGLDFVRGKVYVGAMMKMELEPGNLNECLEMKARLRSTAELWADIHDRSGVPLGHPDFLSDCGHALRGMADSLIISGENPEHTVSLIRQVKERFPRARVLVGGGANAGNVCDFMKCADGVIIASSLKLDGKISNPIDTERTKRFIDALSRA